MTKVLALATALTLLSAPALAQYGGGGQNSGGPYGSALRAQGVPGWGHGYGYSSPGYFGGGAVVVGPGGFYGGGDCYVVHRRTVDAYGRLVLAPVTICD